jgi:hypothetical protein
MRDITKSMLSYTWAVSMFGVQQAANMFRGGRQQGSRATDAFDDITGAVTEQFDDTFKAAFRAGDSVQRGLVDLMFGGMGTLNPDMWRQFGDRIRSAGASVTQNSSTCCGGTSAKGEETMPPGSTFGRAPGD